MAVNERREDAATLGSRRDPSPAWGAAPRRVAQSDPSGVQPRCFRGSSGVGDHGDGVVSMVMVYRPWCRSL